jgi:hypothetical protein
MAVEVAAAYGFDFPAPIAVRAAVAMVIGVAVFEQPMFGSGPRATRDEIVEELAAMLTYGVTRRPVR